MVKHIVLWKLHEHADGHAKQDNRLRAKEMLESMKGQIPGMLNLEVGFDFLGSEASADIILYTEFESHAALENYRNHPSHEAVKPLMYEISRERRTIDYEVC